jgi:ornithine carbamoyltransferase
LPIRHLLSISDLSPRVLQRILDSAMALKEGAAAPQVAGKTLALIFEKPSLRTRVSFHVAMRQLAGDCVYLSPPEVGLGERETAPDVARVLSRYVHGIAARTFDHGTVEELAQYATVPVINALSETEHPCQALADLLTIRERKGRLEGVSVAFIGDGNNVANSLAIAGSMMGMDIRVASPDGYELTPETRAVAGDAVTMTDDPLEATDGADVVYTDVWASMGQEAEASQRREAFAGFTVDSNMMARAKPDAIFMHDLPAHRGEEVATEVIDGPQSVVFDQAENRLHAQKAVLAYVFEDEA